LTILTAKIVTAFVAGQEVAAAGLPSLIQQVYATLKGLAGGWDGATVDGVRPAVPVKESVFPDRVICLECGFAGTMLRRHLSKAHDLSPDAYRAKWSLPVEYPIVSPNYAEVRSMVAKRTGLGVGRKNEST
jgi:predicted transcriptional regulator